MYNKKSIEHLANQVKEYLKHSDISLGKAPYLSSSLEKVKKSILFLGGELIFQDDFLHHEDRQKIGDGVIQTFQKSDSKFQMIMPYQVEKEQDAFEVAHEIGHLFIHLKYGSPDYQKDIIFHDTITSRSEINATDYEANHFAECFMMPKKEFQQVYSRCNQSISDIAIYFGVSSSAVSSRIKSLKLGKI
ncbi:MAG: Zn-dependent peptidase ImmA (M78 family) [bacterium]|jgi:Zn-dependent peptidase ImmA (M78 family)